MQTFILRFGLALALAAGAWLSWSESARADRLAEAKQQIATLQYSDVDRDVDPATSATAAYWLGQYGSVTADTGSIDDAHLLRTAANAAFRQSQREITGSGIREPFDSAREGARVAQGGPGSGKAVQALDGVLQAYAAALKASAQSPSPASGAALAEAAYNYEFVARLRDQVARAAPGKTPKPAPEVAAAGDLPSGPTIHGGPGMPPPDAKMEELEMLAPMDYGDRETQPQATPGGKRERKG
jgi:hypothetical protein